MDCEMPVMDGYEATKELTDLMAKGELDTIPIIAATSYDDKPHIRACSESGMAAYLPKPIMIEELKNTLLKLGIYKPDE